jgi:hypothetical protein
MANIGFYIADSTVANVLKVHGIEPAPDRQRSMSWSTFLKAHWSSIFATDFTTVEVWTRHGLITFYVMASGQTSQTPVKSFDRAVLNASSGIIPDRRACSTDVATARRDKN